MTASNSPPDDEILAHGVRVSDGLIRISGAGDAAACLAELRRLRSCRTDLEALAVLAEPDPEVTQDAIIVLGERAGRGGKGLAAEVWGRIEKRIGAGAPAAPAAPVDAIDIPEPGLVPGGYRVLASGTYRVGPEGQLTRVCRQPLVLAGLARDLDGGPSYCRLRWHARDAWHDVDVPRVDALARTRLPAAVVDAGLVVSSESAGDVVGYLEAALASADTLPEATTSRSMGWRPGGYLLGSTWLPSEPGGADVRLADSDAGARQLGRAYRGSGTWEGWTALVRSCLPYPRVVLGILASLSAPLLAKIGPQAANFIVDYAGETSQGKTTTLRIAASAWGNPSERDGVILSWDVTRTYLERAAAACCDLPLFVDDSKRANPKTIADFVYQVANGQGRGRGTVTGLQTTAQWRTVLLSTGEQPLTSYTEAAGAAARVLTMWGSPLAGVSEADIAAMTRAAHEHHGHAGPRLVEWLLTHPDAASTWHREGVAAAQDTLARASRGAPGAAGVAGRASGYLGTLWAAWRALLALGVDVGIGWVDVAVDAVVRAAVQADAPARALAAIASWVAGNQHRIEGTDAYADAPSGETWGRSEVSEVLLRPDVVRRHLAELGYDADAVLRSWSDRGWTRKEGSHNLPKSTIGGSRIRCVAILRSALEAE